MNKEWIDNLVAIHKVDGALLTNSHGIYHITRKDIGLLKLRSGQIMIADPLVRYRAEDFAQSIGSHCKTGNLFCGGLYGRQ